jgi:hypothetical protein
MTSYNQHKNIEHTNRRIEKCQHAPEWAEHARNFMESDPCDDGRQGIICGNRFDEPSCSL